MTLRILHVLVLIRIQTQRATLHRAAEASGVRLGVRLLLLLLRRDVHVLRIRPIEQLRARNGLRHMSMRMTV